MARRERPAFRAALFLPVRYAGLFSIRLPFRAGGKPPGMLEIFPPAASTFIYTGKSDYADGNSLSDDGWSSGSASGAFFSPLAASASLQRPALAVQ